MASPHTAGVAALFLQGRPTSSPAAVRQALYDRTTRDKVTNANSTNDHLLFTSY